MAEREPELDEYLGSNQSLLGLTLFAVGAAVLLVLAVLVPTFAYKPGKDALPLAWVLGFVAWAILAVGVGLQLRRGRGSRAMVIIALILAVPLAIAYFWMEIFQGWMPVG